MAQSRRPLPDCPDTADSGLEDDPLTSSVGDLRSLSDPELAVDLELQGDLELSGTGRGLLEVPVQNAAVTAQLKQFLRAVRSPQQRRRVVGVGSCSSESPLDGTGGGSRSPIEGRPDAAAGELEFDWWAGQFSICGAQFDETDLFSWYLETNRKVGTWGAPHFL